MIRLLLGRHGETDWNRDGRWQGHADRPLNAARTCPGAALAARIARLQPIALYSSDLARACQTAEPVVAATGLAAVPCPGSARSTSASGRATPARRSKRAIQSGIGVPADAGTGYPGGETFATLKRSRSPRSTRSAPHADGDVIAIICHGGTIRALTSAALKLPRAGRILAPGPANCSLSQLGWNGGALRVISYNDTGHLDPTDLI